MTTDHDCRNLPNTCCGTARMFLVASGVNRVPQNHKKKGTDRVASMVPKRINDNERYRTPERKTQER